MSQVYLPNLPEIPDKKTATGAISTGRRFSCALPASIFALVFYAVFFMIGGTLTRPVSPVSSSIMRIIGSQTGLCESLVED